MTGGNAMLAVRKHRLDELPLDTVLSDGMNMAGGPQLSSVDAWQVTVRVSPHGSPMAQKGDPFNTATVTTEQLDKRLLINIDQRWPEYPED